MKCIFCPDKPHLIAIGWEIYWCPDCGTIENHNQKTIKRPKRFKLGVE